MSEGLSERRRLHPATLIARWLKSVPQMLAAGIGLAVAGRDGGFERFLWVAAAAVAIGAAFALLYWWRFTYRIGANEIVIEKGLLRRQRRIIPFDRIQDVAIEQRLLARLFGTARVRVETGGSAKDEGDLDMIALADAHKLRDRVRRGPGGEAAPRPAGEPTLFEMGVGRLLLSGLFGFSLIFLAAIGAAVQQLDQLGIDWLGWITPEQAEAAAGLATVRAALVLAAFVLLLGVLAGVARTVARDFGFRLTRAEGGLRRRRGLFTLSEVVIPIRRAQVAVIDSGPVARLFGWHGLSFQTLGADRKEGGVQVAAPFARLAEILPILAEAGFPEPPPRAAFHRIPRRGLLRQAFPFLLLMMLAAAAGFVIDPRAGLAAAALLIGAVLVVLRWRKHGHKLGEATLFVSGGLLRRRLWIVPFEKAQTISVSRSPLQRRLQLASLLVDTAGASTLRSPEMVDLDAAEADRMAARLLASFHSARQSVLQGAR